MNEKMEKALNEHMNKELYSSYLYLSMAGWSEANKIKGVAHWLQCQAKEEMIHLGKFYSYINNRDGRIELFAVDKPPAEWSSVQSVFEETHKHEMGISQAINELVSLSIELGDHATQTFLQWFVTEQVEEEAMVKDILDKMSLLGEAPGGLYMLDNELAQRLPPTLDQVNASA